MQKDFSVCLLIEGSGAHLAMGLFAPDKRFLKIHESLRQHSQFLLEDIKTLLCDAKLDFSDLDVIAFTAGPGSFTGLRLVASAVQAIAFAHTIPVVPLSSFQTIAQAVYQNVVEIQTLLIAQEARQTEIYWGGYQYHHAEGVKVFHADCLGKYDDLSTFLNEHSPCGVLANPAMYAFLQAHVEVSTFLQCEMPSPEQLIESLYFLACKAVKNGNLKTAKDALPIYLGEWGFPP